FERSLSNRISHVVLYEYKAVPNPDPTKFALIGSSVLPDVVKSKFEAGMSSKSGGSETRALATASATTPRATPGREKDKDKDKDKDTEKKGPRRTEFIILFVWYEPTPSDDRLETKPAAGGGSKPTGPVGLPSAGGAPGLPK